MRFISLILLACLASSCTTTVRHEAGYQAALFGANNQALILPPAVEVNIVDFAGKKERLYDYEYHLEDVISQEMIEVLEKEGFKAKILSRRNLHDQDLSRDEAKLRERYVEIREKLYKKISLSEKEAFSIDENVGRGAALVGAKNDAGFLIVIDYLRSSKTGGARTADFMMDVLLRTNKSQDADKAVIVVGIIEARTGNVLWTNLGLEINGTFSAAIDKSSTHDKEAAKRLKTLLTKMFEPLAKDKQKG